MESSLLLQDGLWDVVAAVAPLLVPDFTLAEAVELAILQALLQGKPVTPATIAVGVAGSWNRRWGTALLAVKALLAAGHLGRQDGRLAITERGRWRAVQLQVMFANAALFAQPVYVPRASVSWPGLGF